MPPTINRLRRQTWIKNPQIYYWCACVTFLWSYAWRVRQYKTQSLVHYLAGWAIPIDCLVISDDLLAHEAALQWDKNTSERLLEREMDEQPSTATIVWNHRLFISLYTPHSHLHLQYMKSGQLVWPAWFQLSHQINQHKMVANQDFSHNHKWQSVDFILNIIFVLLLTCFDFLVITIRFMLFPVHIYFYHRDQHHHT